MENLSDSSDDCVSHDDSKLNRLFCTADLSSFNGIAGVGGYILPDISDDSDEEEKKKSIAVCERTVEHRKYSTSSYLSDESNMLNYYGANPSNFNDVGCSQQVTSDDSDEEEKKSTEAKSFHATYPKHSSAEYLSDESCKLKTSYYNADPSIFDNAGVVSIQPGDSDEIEEKSEAATYSLASEPRKRKLSCEESDQTARKHHNRYDGDRFAKLAVPVENTVPEDSRGRYMMEKMGYTHGKGLGKDAQGRVAPIEMSKQRGRRGLGLTLPGLEAATLHWDSSVEVVEVKETPVWLDGSQLEAISLDELRSWKQEGEKICTMDGFTDFCDPDLLKNVLSCKSKFDALDAKEMMNARMRSNPFETIRSGIFLNRAAMKMANMDSVFDFMFTNPTFMNNELQVPSGNLLYFADVCAGPGGFSEYVLWRKNWRTKGFGFTLIGEHDFRLEDFYSGPCESFEPFYGVKKDGNVYDPDNINSLKAYVMENTSNRGVHFMMADGGFSVHGQENNQELLSKQLYLCQFLVALTIVRIEGHFVCKLFDIFSPFSAGLVYLMYRSFRKVCIHKPNTSRPANSERYLICRWKRASSESIRQYMHEMNMRLWELGDNRSIDITECVPLAVLSGDSRFFDYLVESNNSLGERQVINLMKIAAFCQDTNLVDHRQADIRRDCLAYWKVPDQARRSPDDVGSPEDMTNTILGKTCDRGLLGGSQPYLVREFRCPAVEFDSSKQNPYRAHSRPLKAAILELLLPALLVVWFNAMPLGFLTKPPTLLTPDSLESSFKNILDWRCVISGNEKGCLIYLGLGRTRVYYMKQSGTWQRLEPTHGVQSKLELSRGTLLLAEVVEELVGEEMRQYKRKALHIVDAFMLGMDNISQKSYNERLKACQLFAHSITKRSNIELYPIRVKDTVELTDVNSIFQRLTYRNMKTCRPNLVVEKDDYMFQPKGIIFLKLAKEPWQRHWSNTWERFYYGAPSQKSVFENESEPHIHMTTMDCWMNIWAWVWQAGVGVKSESPKDGVLHKDVFLESVKDVRKKTAAVSLSRTSSAVHE